MSHKIFMRYMFTLIVLTGFLTEKAQATQWSRFITTKKTDDIAISFRQMKINNAWSVEWKVNNESADTIEPILKSRQYVCDDKSSLSFTTTSLGIYLPGSKRLGGILDDSICPNSKIKLVEIKTEIIPIKLESNTANSIQK